MDATVLSRPRSLDEMRARFEKFRTEEGTKRALEFTPRPSDVFVATYPKSGTTWMQQIVHGLRTAGDMDFDEITEVVPWIEMGFDLDLDIEAEQAAFPRAYKTHFDWNSVPKGGRYIYVIRDPKDVAVSLYHFMEGWFLEPGAVSFEEFLVDHFCNGTRSGRYWGHILSWWPQRGREDCLFLTFEDMRADLRGAVERVARFIGLDVPAATIDIATRQAGLDFMKAHEHQFDDHIVAERRDPVCGIPPGSDSSKLRDGQVGGHKARVTPELAAMMDRIWDETIGAELGFADYEALRKAVKTQGA